MIAIWRIFSVAYRKAKVRLQKEEERDRRTHFLQIQRGSNSQHTKENTVGDIPAWGHRRKDVSGYGKQARENTLTSWEEQKGTCQDTERRESAGTLTFWRGQKSELVRKWKDNKLARDTHSLERAEVGIGENMESKQASKGHSLPREGRGWDWW
jgi:hypothetical protein